MEKTLHHPSSLTRLHILDALDRCADAGISLEFSRLDLSDIGAAAAEELALIGNGILGKDNTVERVTFGHNRLAALPTEFALLSSLRYLNLKYNCFTVFPEVLTLLISLDTLDISHNKIRRLPSYPGQLVNLRVLSLSRNKLSHLPPYLAKFHRLDVLQADKNPIEWPPKIVMEALNQPMPGMSMKDRIHYLQNWIESNGRETKMRAEYDVQGEKDVHPVWRFPIQEIDFDAGVTPHARTFSIDSNISLSSATGSPGGQQALSRPPPLNLHIATSDLNGEGSPAHSPEEFLPSPSDAGSFEQKASEREGDYVDSIQPQHLRTGSLAGVNHFKSTKAFTIKKSLPDLRTAHQNFFGLADSEPSSFHSINKNDLNDPPVSTSSFQNAENHSTQWNASTTPTTMPSLAWERNSYFRRLSTLTTAGSIPKHVSCLIESARSILFVMCQVYHAIEHYAIHAIDDRLASVLRKVLDPAGVDMIQLIHSLDRFDTSSQKSLPPPAACRSVVESCRDTVAVFNKALGVLALQLKVIATSDDVRYSRWILLELYAATVEISCAWQSMMPHIDAIRPMLYVKSLSNMTATDINGIPTSTHSEIPHSMVRMRSVDNLVPGIGPVGRMRMARRHAGSFSSKDVEIGKQLPSYETVPTMIGGIASAMHKPTLRAPKRQITVPLTTLSNPSFSTRLANNSSTSTSTLHDRSHSSHDSYSSHVLRPSYSSTPSLPPDLSDLPSYSKIQVDKEALHAVQGAIEVAPGVWNMIEDALADAPSLNSNIRESLSVARNITGKLSNTIKAVYTVDSSVNRKMLRDDAHLFLKSVVQLSNIVKTYGANHPVTAGLRSSIVKLTNSTEEFAILLHVSSFSPSVSRSYSPTSYTSATPLAVNDDIRLGFNFLRNQENWTNRWRHPPDSRSVQTSQIFKSPAIRRLRSAHEARVDTRDPG